jgi:hypothetical protein
VLISDSTRREWSHREVLMSLRTCIAGLGIAVVLSAFALAGSAPASAQPPHRCASAAGEQAQKLLVFHFGPDGRIEIDKLVKVLAPVRNPANRAQRFDVLEVWGHIYKGQYRMRFIYAQLPTECVLMGQEILEYASL